jgi:membrane protease YdiL (CAAX protease family)
LLKPFSPTVAANFHWLLGTSVPAGSRDQDIGNRLSRWIAALGPWTEFAIVIAVAFGIPITSSLLIAWDPFDVGYTRWPLLYDRGLRHLVLIEIATLLMLGDFLRLRGWTLRRLGILPINLKGVGLGLGLTLLCAVVYVLAWVAFAPLLPEAAATRLERLVAAPGLSLVMVAATVLINPVFEETFVCGYIISFIEHRSNLLTAIAVSLAVRTSYHLYQGALGTMINLSIGIILTLAYVRIRRLSPLMVAHALCDFAALGIYIVQVTPI